MSPGPGRKKWEAATFPVISAGWAFMSSMDGMNLFVAGFPDACSSMGPQGGHPWGRTGESFRAVRVRRPLSRLIRTLWTDLSRRNKSKLQPHCTIMVDFFSQLHLEQAGKGTNELFWCAWPLQENSRKHQSCHFSLLTSRVAELHEKHHPGRHSPYKEIGWRQGLGCFVRRNPELFYCFQKQA